MYLTKDAVPYLNGKLGVGDAQDSDEMVSECAYGAFGSVLAMDVGRSQLRVDFFVSREVAKHGRGFIVQSL